MLEFEHICSIIDEQEHRLTDFPSPARRAEHWACAAVFFVNGFGFASWVSRIPAVRDALLLTESQLGMALLAMGVGALCAFQLTGRGLGYLSARTLTLATGFLYCYALPQPVMVGSRRGRANPSCRACTGCGAPAAFAARVWAA
jgi:hypothetical protein